MLYGNKSKQDLDRYVEKLVSTITTRKSRRELYDHLKRKFDMPESVAADIVTLKKDMAEFTPFELFAVLYCVKKETLGKFFTEAEIQQLAETKMTVPKIKLPLQLQMLKVADNQWIGATDMAFIMKLREAQMLNYDENEQRALQIIKRGEIEIRKPFVSRKAVEEIREAMENGTYIPDAITLNMTDNAEYEYDNSACTLSIYSLPRDMFNLIDGYHRTLAMSEIHQFNAEFNLPMELRIVSFTRSEAEAFVFQQDQKTLMKKVVSDSYDPNTITNRIIVRINKSPEFLLQNEINRNGGKIDQARLAKLIAYYYLQDPVRKADQPKVITTVASELIKKFNELLEQVPELMDGMNVQQLCAAMFVFSKPIDAFSYGEAFRYLLSDLSSEEKGSIIVDSFGRVRRKGINILEGKYSKWR